MRTFLPTRIRHGAASVLIGTLAVGGMVAVAPQAAQAGAERTSGTCTRFVTGTLEGAQTVVTGEKVCLRGATVNGAITVQPNASLSVSNSRVNGAITLSHFNTFDFCGSTTVGGAISASSGGAVRIGNLVSCQANTVDGAITLVSNTGYVVLARTTTSGAVTVSSTDDVAGVAPTIANNTIGGALTCESNAPAPKNKRFPNVVVGGRTGQCASPAF